MLISQQKFKWIQPPQHLNINQPFIKVKQVSRDKISTKIQLLNTLGKFYQIDNDQCYDCSDKSDFNDMCDMNVLNQPEILNNIKIRFKRKQIFTHIGSTLLVVNPYQYIQDLYNEGVLQKYRNNILKSQKYKKQDKISNQYQIGQQNLLPHIYLLAGNAYKQLVFSDSNQTIIISGQSGSGKTQSTKHCLSLLTSLSHSSHHSIEQKILSCNPILQAFGNSKTMKNDNSSRFGKYIQINFDQDKNIIGANIKSYLLQKSRVIALQKGQRNYHCFYALTQANTYSTKQAKQYVYLNKGQCFKANNIQDKQNFIQINHAMRTVGFSDAQIDTIWKILKCILEIGNLQIDDANHHFDESQPCQIKNIQMLQNISITLGLKTQELEKFFLYQRRKFMKQFMQTPYNINSCRANMDSLSKQLYSSTFDFILYKINQKLKPQIIQKGKHFSPTINILDIFGFQNFEKNSFEQMCINFTNEKLFSLYNKYIFQKQIDILKEDGLQGSFQDLVPPSNQTLLSIIYSKKVSIFSIINDLTPHQQYKDIDILFNLKKQLNHVKVQFPQKNPNCFVIKHSACDVSYEIQGFKNKNKDRVKQQIQKITNSLLISNKKTQNIQDRTLLSKFSNQIQQLMKQLESNKVHFVRCLKPNNQKQPNLIDQKYLLNQIRYLGIFQTIKVRKIVFPFRKTYQQFQIYYQQLFARNNTVQNILKSITHQQTQYILGNKRIYLSPKVQQILTQKHQKIRKFKIQAANKIQRQYKVYKFRKLILKNLKKLKFKVRLLRKYSHKNYLQNNKIVFSNLIIYCRSHKQAELKRIKLKLQEQNQIKIKQKQQNVKQKQLVLNRKLKQRKQKIPKMLKLIQKIYIFQKKKQYFKCLLTYFENKIQKTNYDSIQNYDSISLTISNYDSISSTIIDQNDQPYYQKQQSRIKKQIQQSKIYSFPKQFVNYNSIIRCQQQILFKYNLKIPLFDQKTGSQKLQSLIKANHITQKTNDQDKQLKQSNYINFQTSTLDKQTYNRLSMFSQESFCQKYLRKRSKLVGKAKDFNQIFVAKRKPLEKSLTRLEKQNQQYALKVFKQILKINKDGNQQFVLKVIQIFLSLMVDTPQQIVNQVFLQLLKQVNTDKEIDAIKALKMVLCFLHFFRPDKDFLDAGMFILFQRIQCHMYTQKQESYVRMCFRKAYHKYINPKLNTKYIPSKYQLYCLICKKQFPFKFYLSMGNCIQYNVESDQTFGNIKQKLLQKFGINTKRINSKYFSVFQIITFQEGEMQEVPISDNDLVWDLKSYWEIAISRYQQHQITPPKFYFLVKLKFPFELQNFDLEGIQLIYGECFFDYFTGKVQVPLQLLIELAQILLKIKNIKMSQFSKKFIFSIFPLWAIRKHTDQKLISMIKSPYQKQKPTQQSQVSTQQLYNLKFSFIRLLQPFPLTMGVGMPPESDLLADSSLLYYLKPRRLYIVQKQNMQILQEFQLRKLLSWEVDQEKLSFQVIENGGNNAKTHILYTEYAQLFSDYLREIGDLTKANI